MRVWLYARLSNDDDPAQNSLQNQQEICRAFAEKKGWSIAGSSSDDNISGMNFSRRGLDTLTAAVQAKQIDAVLVKDLSRLGRHRTQTALFIDFLRQQQVRVISVTEGVDTFCEEDDLMIGVRGLMNDYYAKDIGKKIRAGYRQKQKEGLVITPPFGYWKDRNTNQVLVQPEAAETVQLIYSLYLQGCGQKEIARRLNSLGRKTPAQIMAERIGYDSQKPHKTRDGQFLWTYVSVKNILVEEAYTGVLVNHRREYLDGKARAVGETDWLRHENFYPVIIEKAIWEQVQTRLKQQARPAVNNRTKHRYAGATDLSGMWEYVQSHDPLLERQEPCGICMPWIPPERKRLLQPLTGFMRRFWIKRLGSREKAAGTVRSRTEKGHTVAKTVGIEETSPRRPLFDFAERNFEIGAGSRRTGDGENTDIKNKYFY